MLRTYVPGKFHFQRTRLFYDATSDATDVHWLQQAELVDGTKLIEKLARTQRGVLPLYKISASGTH